MALAEPNITAKDPATGKTASLPRAIGTVRLSAKRRGQRTALDTLFQQGSAKAMLPQTFEAPLTAVLLNTAGGVTGGDRFNITATARSNAHVTLASQTAERAYRALPGTEGRIHTTLSAETGATLHWLPQETILFNGAALKRRLTVDLAQDASFLAVEPMVLGRQAMGETVTDIRLSDQWRVRRNGHLVYADAVRIQDNPEQIVNSTAGLDGNRAFASILLAAPDAERHLKPLRALLPETGGASLIRPGILAARLMAPDTVTLRRTMIPALEVLRGAPLPTTWRL